MLKCMNDPNWCKIQRNKKKYIYIEPSKRRVNLVLDIHTHTHTYIYIDRRSVILLVVIGRSLSILWVCDVGEENQIVERSEKENRSVWNLSISQKKREFIEDYKNKKIE